MTSKVGEEPGMRIGWASKGLFCKMLKVSAACGVFAVEVTESRNTVKSGVGIEAAASRVLRLLTVDAGLLTDASMPFGAVAVFCVGFPIKL